MKCPWAQFCQDVVTPNSGPARNVCKVVAMGTFEATKTHDPKIRRSLTLTGLNVYGHFSETWSYMVPLWVLFWVPKKVP